MFGGSTTTHTLEAQLVAEGEGEFNRSLQGAKSGLLDFENAVIGVGGALTALSVGAMGKAVSAASEYETAMVELQKVTDATTVEALNSELLEMSKVIPLTATELADIAAQAGQFGIRGADNIAKFTEQVSKMAIATDLTVEEAGTSFAKLAALTETPVSKVGDLGSAINTMSNIAATSAGEVVDSMLRASSSLTQMGVKAPQIVALSGALNAVSESSERAGTRLRTLAQEMVDPRKIGDLARAMGMTVVEFERMRDTNPYKLIRQMAVEFQNGTDKATALSGVLGTSARQAVSGLAQNIDGLDASLAEVNGQFANGTSLNEEFAAASQTFSNQLQLLRNNVTAVGIQLGQVFLPYLTKAASAVGGAVGKFAEWNEKLNNAPALIGVLVTAITGLTLAATGLATKFGFATSLMGGFRLALLGVTGPLALAAGAVYAYQKNLFGLQDAVGETIDTLRKAWTQALPAITDYVNAQVAILSNEFNRSLTRIKAAWEETFGALPSSASGPLGKATDIVVKFAGGLALAVKSGVGAMVSVVKGGIQTVESVILGTLALVRGDWREGWRQFSSIPARGISAVRQSVTAMNLPAWIGKPIDDALERWQNGWRLIQLAGAINAVGMKEKVGTPIQFAMGMVTGAFENTKEAVLDVYGVFSGLYSKHAPKVLAVIRPIADKVGSLAQKFGLLDDEMKPTVKTVTAVGLALTGLAGGPVGLAIAGAVSLYQAWKDNLFGIRDHVDTVTGEIDKKWKAFKPKLTATVESIQSGIDTVMNNYVPTIVSRAEQTAAGVERAWTDAKPVLKNVVDEITGGIDGAWKASKPVIISTVNATTSEIDRQWTQLKPKVIAAVSDMVTEAGDEYATLKADVKAAMPEIKSAALTGWRLLKKESTPILNAYKTTATSTFEEIAASAGTNAPKVKRAMTSNFKSMTPIIRDTLGFLAIGVVKPALQALNRLIDNHAGETVEEFIETYVAIAEEVSAGLADIAEFWRRHRKIILPILAFLVDGIIGIIEGLFDTLFTLIRVGLNIIQGDWEEAWQEIVDWTERTIGGLIGFFTKWGGLLMKHAINPALESVHKRFKQWSTNTKNAVTNTWDAMVESAKKWKNQFFAPIEDGLEWVENKFRWLKRTVVGNSIVPEMFTALIRSAKNWKPKFKNPFETTFADIEKRMGTWSNRTQTKLTGWKNQSEKKYTNWKATTKNTVNSWAGDTGKRLDTHWTATSNRLGTWKKATEGKYTGWKNATKSTVNNWASETGSRLNAHWASTSNRLGAWKRATEGKYNNWKSTTKSTVSRWAGETHSKLSSHWTNTSNRLGAWKSTTEGKYRTWKGNVKSAVSTATSDISTTYNGFKRGMESKNRGLLGNMTSKAWSWVPNFKRPFENAMDNIESRFSKMKKKVVGNSIVPEMLDDLIREAEPWAGKFTKPFKNAVNNIIAEFERARKQSKQKTSNLSKSVKSTISSIPSDVKKYFEREIWGGTWAFDAPKTGRKHAEALRRGVKGFTGEYRGNGRTNNMAANFSALSRAGLLSRSKENVLSTWFDFYKNRKKHQKYYADKYGYDMDATEAALSRFINSWEHSPFEMAEGGIVTGPTNAIVGEKGPEAVLPLKRLPEIMAKAGEKVARRTSDGSGSGDVHINVDTIQAGSRSEARNVMAGLFDEADARLRRR